MTPDETLNLTDRQRQVADLLSRHYGMKEIARELNIAISTVSDHVTALKRIFGATSHAEIVAGYLQHFAGIAPDDGPEKRAQHFFRIPESPQFTPEPVADDPGQLGFGDGADFPVNDWPLLTQPSPSEQRIVPRWLDGKHAVATRLAVILAGIFVLLAAIVLSVSAMNSVSEIVSGSDPDLELRNKPAA